MCHEKYSIFSLIYSTEHTKFFFLEVLLILFPRNARNRVESYHIHHDDDDEDDDESSQYL